MRPDLVRAVERRADLREDRLHLGEREELSLLQPEVDDLPQRQPIEELRGEVRAIFRLALFVHPHDVGVRELARQPQLLAEGLPLVRRLQQLGVDDLEGDLDVDLLVVRAKDEAQRPHARHVLDEVALGDEVLGLVGRALHHARHRATPTEGAGGLSRAAAAQQALPARRTRFSGIRRMGATTVAEQREAFGE